MFNSVYDWLMLHSGQMMVVCMLVYLSRNGWALAQKPGGWGKSTLMKVDVVAKVVIILLIPTCLLGCVNRPPEKIRLSDGQFHYYLNQAVNERTSPRQYSSYDFEVAKYRAIAEKAKREGKP